MIAEDQVLLRDGLVRLLSEDGHRVVAQVGDARHLVEQVNEHRPDLVIADNRMPPGFDDDGARAVALLRRRFPALAALMLTQAVEPSLVAAVAGPRVQAFGYVLKDRVLDTASFLAQVRTVGEGGTAIDPAIVDGYLQRDGGRLHELSEREMEVLSLVASGRSNAGIAAELVVSRRTVDAHLRSIFTKLDLGAGPEDNQRVLAVLGWLAGNHSHAGPRASGERTKRSRTD